MIKLKAFTDYPFTELGDIAGKQAPIRSCIVTSYDGDKYCKIVVGKLETEVKAGYLYKTAGRCGEVACIDVGELQQS